MAQLSRTGAAPAVLSLALLSIVRAQAAPLPAGKMVELPSGSFLSVELVDPVSSAKNKPGDVFRARVLEGVWVDGTVAVPPGTTVRGEVTAAEGSGRLKKRARLDLVLRELQLGATRYSVETDSLTYSGDKHAGKTVGALLGGALQGALYGVLFGGKSGAIIGAGAGAGASGIGKVLTGKQEVEFEQGARLLFETLAPVGLPAGAPGEKPREAAPVDLSAPKAEEKTEPKEETAKPSS